MPRHLEVLTAIANDSKEFERCPHITRQTLQLAGNIVLSQEQPAFSAPDAKNQPKVFKRENGQTHELVGVEREAALKQLRDSTQTETALFAQVNDKEIHLAGASISLALYQHRTSGELWVGKSDVLDGGRLSRIAVLKERIANDIYAYYGVSVPRLAVAQLACCYRTAYNQQIYGEEMCITTATHLLSRWLDRFNTYPDMPDFSTPATIAHYSLPINDQLIPEKGLGQILAVAHFIHDVDVTNAAGKNIGYRLRTDTQGKLYAQTCKIDPGYAFHDIDEPTSPAYRITQAMPLKTYHREQDYVRFAHFPRATQTEFIATVADIVDTPEADLVKFFRREGTEALQHDNFTNKAIALLKTRQAGLKKAFAAELAAYRAEAKAEQKEAKSIATLTAELQPIYARTLLESSDPIFRQAQHFYIEPSTTVSGNKEEASKPLPEMLQQFFADKEARVLLLLGDSGFGKSTTTQQIAQQHWQKYVSNHQQGRIAIRIELKQFTARTVGRCVDNVLMDDYRLTAAQIAILKTRPCVILLDGFDEIGDRGKYNLWDTNRLSDWKDVKLVVTCRPAYLEYSDIATHFYPAGKTGGIQQRYLAPFNEKQIEAYLTKVLAAEAQTISTIQKPAVPLHPLAIGLDFFLDPSKAKPEGTLSSEVKEIKETKSTVQVKSLAASSTLQELLQIPLMLKIFTEALPELQRQEQDLTQLNRYKLYEAFMQQWFERNRARLSQNLGRAISPAVCTEFLHYSQDLALALYQANQLEINYAPGQAHWDQFFSQSDEPTIQLRSGCPLRRVGNQYSFIHKSFYEFFLAQRLIRAAEETSTAPLIALINTRPIQAEPQVLQFLHQARQSQPTRPAWIETLFATVKQSASQPIIAQASANAATILNACDEALMRQAWAGVQLPGADLSYCVLAHSDLSGANLEGATLTHAMLYQTNLQGANLRQVSWGEFPRLELKEDATAIAWHPTQPVMAVGQGDTILQFNSDTGEQIGAPLTGHTNWITSVAYRPDGRRLVSGSADRTVRLWDAETGQPLGAPLTGHTDRVTSVAYRPDGRRLVSGSWDHTLRQWNAETGAPIGAPLIGHMWVNSVAYRPDGRCLVSGSKDKTVRQWNAETGQPIGAPFAGHDDAVTSVAYRPDGRRLVSGSADRTVRLWDAETGKQIGAPLTGHTNWITSVAYRPDGRRLVSGSRDTTLRQWDAETGAPIDAPLTGHMGWVMSAAYRPDGRRLVSGSADRTVRLWDAETGKQIGAPLTGHTNWITSVAYRPDGRRLVSGSKDKTVRLWDAETGKQIGAPLTGHTDRVTSVAYRPDGRRLMSGSADRTVRQWDAETGQALGAPLTEHTRSVTSVAYRPDGRRLVSGSEDKTVRLWDAETGEALSAPLTEHTRSVTSVAYRPDGRHLVSASHDNTLRLWDAETGQALGAPLTGHTSAVRSVVYRPDGRRLVSGSWDNTVRLWDAESGKCLAILQWQQPISSIALIASPLTSDSSREPKPIATLSQTTSPATPQADEDWLAIGDAAGTISLWAISVTHPETGFRLLAMPKHSGMPLLLNGAQLRDCQMSAMSKRLLEQHGGDVSGVIISESKAASQTAVGESKDQPPAASSKLKSPIAGGLSTELLEVKEHKQQSRAIATEQPAPKISPATPALPHLPASTEPQPSATSFTTTSMSPVPKAEVKTEAKAESPSVQNISSTTVSSTALSPFATEQIRAIRQTIIATPTAKPLSLLDEEAQMQLLFTPMHEVLPGLYIGDYEAYRQISQQKNKCFTAAVKVTAQRHDDPAQAFYYAPVPAGLQLLDIGQGLSDRPEDWPLLKSRLPQAFALLDQALAQKQSVLVFCSQGASRSPTVVIAYLVYRFGVSTVQADNFVKTKRPQANSNFLAQLKTEEAALRKLGQGVIEDKTTEVKRSTVPPVTTNQTSLPTTSAAPLKQEVVNFVRAIDQFLKTSSNRSQFFASAAAGYASTIIGCLRKPPAELTTLLAQPELYSLPKNVAGFISQYLTQHPDLQHLRQYPELAQQLKKELCQSGDLNTLLQRCLAIVVAEQIVSTITVASSSTTTNSPSMPRNS